MAKHEHFPAFMLDLNALKTHLKNDHGLAAKDVPKDGDVVKWHNMKHPEIKPQNNN
jgi:hypothetical protein